MNLRWTRIVWLVALTMFTGCGQSGPVGGGGKTLSPSELTETQQGQHEIALAARDALFQRLLERLMEALTSSGPAAAIEVCGRQAPQIAADVSQQYGVSIGRTSHRLRNPKNAAPDWAKSLVDSQVAEPQLIALADGHLGVLLPIRLKAQCLMCHGPKEQVLPDVQAAIGRAYPNDQATGFQEGDLRGWFWLSVPEDAQKRSATERNGYDKPVGVDRTGES